MYFWNINQLKEDIRTNKLTESKRFKYAIVTLAVFAIGMESRVSLENINIWDDISSISIILIQIVGIFFAYKANNGSMGTDFLGRYFAIYFVVSIRFLVFVIPVIIGVLLYYFYAFDFEEGIPSTSVDTIPFIIWTGILYWRVYVHIKQVNSHELSPAE